MRIFCLSLLIGSFLSAAEMEEEALFLRRIADFWQEGEYKIAKAQIEQFIVEYPESSLFDALCSALGDLFLREKNYSNALNYYARVQNPEFAKQIFLNRMQCLYEMQWYATLADECEAYLSKESHLQITYLLAISLYQQCMNSSKEPDQLQKFAERAIPHFETLFQSEFSDEIAQGYAHLCCILKNHPKASKIYLDLAKKDSANEEEMLFQAALIQSEYDKRLALETFDKIASLGKLRSKEAAYNRLVLSFDLGQYEDLTKENLLTEIPADRIGSARFFLSRSLIHLKKYEEALKELKIYIQDAPISETFYAALVYLSDAASRCLDLDALDEAIAKLEAHYPTSEELPKTYFSKSQILKQQARYIEAKEQIEKLLFQFPNFPQKAEAFFEVIDLNFKIKDWQLCHQKSVQFLAEFVEHDLALFVSRYLVLSSLEIAHLNPEHRSQLVNDLNLLLNLPLNPEEKNEWQLQLAKTQYELAEYKQAIHSLENQTNPNARLLLALCYKDGSQDLKQFCDLAEEAIRLGANIIDLSQLHTSLYNAYIELQEIEKGAEHLYAAFMAKAELKNENLLWLADFYYNRILENPTDLLLAKRAAALFEKYQTDLRSDDLIYRQAKINSILGRIDHTIALLQTLTSLSNQAKLLLGQSYLSKGLKADAAALFDAIIADCGKTKRSSIAAAAVFHSVKLKLEEGTLSQIEAATQLKNLVLQKSFDSEPLHLEAALEYVDFLAKDDLTKKIALLQKTKSDFEQMDDLLAKDYHAARLQSKAKNQMYQGYMKLIEAKIFAAQAKIDPFKQKELQAKSKDLLLQIMNEPMDCALEERVRDTLTHES